MAGSKRLLSTVFYQMEAHGINTRKIWHSIKLIVVKTIMALIPEIILHYEHSYPDGIGPQCFHVNFFWKLFKYFICTFYRIF